MCVGGAVKKVLFASAVFLAALGAQSPGAVMAKPLAEPAYSWAGCYGGGNIGYSWGRAKATTAADPVTLFGPFTIPAMSSSASNDLDGVIGGGQVGCNWQPDPHWAFGIETDFQWTGEKGSFSSDDPFSILAVPAPPTTIDGDYVVDPETSISWIGTLRGRVGYVWNDWFLYATGGFAYGRVKSSGGTVTEAGCIKVLRIGCVAFSQSASLSGSKVNPGWTVGGGIEFPLPNRWTWRIEYLYVDLGTLDLSARMPSGALVRSRTEFTDNIVRLGLNYRFMTY